MIIGRVYMDEAEAGTGGSGNSDQEDTPTKPADKPDDSSRELARMKRVLAKLQKERDESLKAVNDLKTAQERERMGEAERAKAEFEDIKASLVREQEARKALETARMRDQQVMELVTHHNLRDSKFGSIVLGELGEDEELGDLVKRLKADPELGVMFKSEQASTGDVDSPGLHGSAGTTASRTNKRATLEQTDKEMAAKLFPYNAAKQKAFIERKKMTRENK